MALIHNLGFPRIGKKREQKFAVEKYWKGEISQQQLIDKIRNIRNENFRIQRQLDLTNVGDHAIYDHILNTSLLFGVVDDAHKKDNWLDTAFSLARGSKTCCGAQVSALSLKKWFNTNYHYLAPELSIDQIFTVSDTQYFDQIANAQSQGINSKAVLVGPVTYLYLAKTKGENFNKLDLLPALLQCYSQVLNKLESLGIQWLQLDEPILALELEPQWLDAIKSSQHFLERRKNNDLTGGDRKLQILLTTYFASVSDKLDFIYALPVAGIHFDLVSESDLYEQSNLALIEANLPADKVLSLGIINGRNIWRTDLSAVYNQLNVLNMRLGDRLWLAPSCSLLHCPVDLNSEQELDGEIKSWLAFAYQKIDELVLLKEAFESQDTSELDEYSAPIKARVHSDRVNNLVVQKRLKGLTENCGKRKSSFEVRVNKQNTTLKLPLLPTTTIGSFPQTLEIRSARRDFRRGDLSFDAYQKKMHSEIAFAVKEQEEIGLDVLVHGEAERNDMVEYFGELLNGFAFSEFGWVQSYGSRCVKPPIIWGDVSRPKPMTVAWTQYAQSLTKKHMKGMLTGPVTILFWSFVRDDLDRQIICNQIALALREEVIDLEQAGINIIQIDEPAFREGMPLKKSQWKSYLDWAAYAFRVSSSGIKDETQIHTHMCYSEFNDIIKSIADMDADVITIETSRSKMELLNSFERFDYPNEIGPGVYDIHSPNVPVVEEMKHLIHKAAEKISVDRLWVNPDCGLKTRGWNETKLALENMVKATYQLRVELA